MPLHHDHAALRLKMIRAEPHEFARNLSAAKTLTSSHYTRALDRPNEQCRRSAL